MTLSGNIGVTVNVTDSFTTVTGMGTQVTSIESAIATINLTTTSQIFSMYGYVGANSYQLDIQGINNVSGTGIDMRVIRNQAGAIGNVKQIVVYNSGTGTLNITPGTSSSYLSTGEKMYIYPGQAVCLGYIGGNSATATARKIAVVGNQASCYHEVYLCGE